MENWFTWSWYSFYDDPRLSEFDRIASSGAITTFKSQNTKTWKESIVEFLQHSLTKAEIIYKAPPCVARYRPIFWEPVPGTGERVVALISIVVV